MFLFCGLLSKNHMLLNLPGIPIPQNANHLLPGLFRVTWGAWAQTHRWEGLQRGLFGLRTIAHPSCLWPVTPYSPIAPSPRCQNKSLSWIHRLLILIKERDVVERAEETTLYSQLTWPIFYITWTLSFLVPFLQMDLFWENLSYFNFLALRLLR